MRKILKKNILVPWDLPVVPRVPISGPNRGIFSKLIWPGPLGSGGYSHTSFSNGRFRDTYTSFHIDVQLNCNVHFGRWRHVDHEYRSSPKDDVSLYFTCSLHGRPHYSRHTLFYLLVSIVGVGTFHIKSLSFEDTF